MCEVCDLQVERANAKATCLCVTVCLVTCLVMLGFWCGSFRLDADYADGGSAGGHAGGAGVQYV